MKLTNRSNLPATYVRAVQNHKYTKGGADFSMTQLCQPTRKAVLFERHHEKLEEDVADRLYALDGSSVGVILEQAAGSNTLAEEILIVEIPSRSGRVYKVKGQPDLFEDDEESLVRLDESGELTDHKRTSVFAVRMAIEHGKPEWTQQLNGYDYMLRQHGFAPKELSITAMIRDWSKTRAWSFDYSRNDLVRLDQSYPEAPIVRIPIDKWDPQEQYNFLVDRVSRLEEARALPDDELPTCTHDEVWERDRKFAVMKEGNKRSTRNFDTAQEARDFIATHKERSKMRVEDRPGHRLRCELFCSVNRFCNQFQEFRAKKMEEAASRIDPNSPDMTDILKRSIADKVREGAA